MDLFTSMLLVLLISNFAVSKNLPENLVKVSSANLGSLDVSVSFSLVIFFTWYTKYLLNIVIYYKTINNNFKYIICFSFKIKFKVSNKQSNKWLVFYKN